MHFYYSFVFAKRNYRVLIRVCVCVYVCVCACTCVCLCVYVCVLLHNNSKSYQSRKMKLEYIVVYYKNISDKFDNGYCQIKIKVTVGLKIFPFSTIKTIRSYNLTLVQARKLILSVYIHLIIIQNIYEYRQA